MAEDERSICHFSQSNPMGPEGFTVPALLRRVADSIEALGGVQVQDLTFHHEVTTTGQDDFSMTVFYHRPE
ncbi:hypothetical protein [Lapillicoccus jejuensis]|uniref:Uncharacterized protein n=1 Tax=Lapillicoccus jejuensis TaxID=402171 RepID=A0A542DZQ5_9MICO|nr:hypothetical protein [Lapillicoccus jejuensis]TQJ08572.1 hypothetical protein FB458_1662 [Lapillicoccus jejuensis]